MKSTFKNRPAVAEALHRARLAAARFALRKAGALLRASAPHVVRVGEKLETLSKHPDLKGPPPGFRV